MVAGGDIRETSLGELGGQRWHLRISDGRGVEFEFLFLASFWAQLQV